MSIERCVACRNSEYVESIFWECLPVPAFGNASASELQVATVGLNPASTEFVAKDKPRTLESRLSMLGDFEISERTQLTDDNVRDASHRRSAYFQNQPHPFFTPLEDLMQAMDPAWSYRRGTAIHLDIVACTTKLAWGKLPPGAKTQFTANCRSNFIHGLMSCPEGAWLLFNGRGCFDALPGQGVEIAEHQETRIPDYGNLAVWFGKLIVGGKRLRFFGWNCFLQRSTGNESLGILRSWRERPAH